MFRILKPGGKIIIVDVMFEPDNEKQRIGEEDSIEEEINDEYFAILERLGGIFKRLGARYKFERINRYIWILEAWKP